MIPSSSGEVLVLCTLVLLQHLNPFFKWFSWFSLPEFPPYHPAPFYLWPFLSIPGSLSWQSHGFLRRVIGIVATWLPCRGILWHITSLTSPTSAYTPPAPTQTTQVTLPAFHHSTFVWPPEALLSLQVQVNTAFPVKSSQSELTVPSFVFPQNWGDHLKICIHFLLYNNFIHINMHVYAIEHNNELNTCEPIT